MHPGLLILTESWGRLLRLSAGDYEWGHVCADMCCIAVARASGYAPVSVAGVGGVNNCNNNQAPHWSDPARENADNVTLALLMHICYL